MTDFHDPTLVCRESCPACMSDKAKTIARVPYADPALSQFLERYYRLARDIDARLRDHVYQIDHCLECGLAFQRFVPSDGFAAVLYGEWLNTTHHPSTEAYQEQLSSPLTSRDGHEILAAAKALGLALDQLKILDYGMGWGLWSLIGQRLGARVFGHELSDVRCEFARENGISVVSLNELEGLDVDFINADQVVEHVVEPSKTIRTLAAALRPGGILKVGVPRVRNLEQRLRRCDWEAPRGSRYSLLAVHPLEHVNCFDDRSLERMCAREGLVRMSVPLPAYGAFLSVPGAVPLRQPRKLLKAFARPFYHWVSPSNLYAWFRKPN